MRYFFMRSTAPTGQEHHADSMGNWGMVEMFGDDTYHKIGLGHHQYEILH